jgi:hypothetical protein
VCTPNSESIRLGGSNTMPVEGIGPQSAIGVTIKTLQRTSVSLSFKRDIYYVFDIFQDFNFFERSDSLFSRPV